jgi:DNA polymerase-3 subunit gamma/tau
LASIFETVPLIEGNEITVTLENKALDDDFNAQKSELLDFIRKELNNYSISVNTIINKDVMIKKAYTPQEKFMKMSEKNPALINLAKAFDAEIGYPID